MQASIQSRLAGAMREQGMRSLLLADPENFGYVAGPMLPYVKQTPDRAVLALSPERTRRPAPAGCIPIWPSPPKRSLPRNPPPSA